MNRQGAIAGLATGALIWAYILLLPQINRAGLLSWQWLTEGPFGISYLAPAQLFYGQFDPISVGVVLSLGANVVMLLLVSHSLRFLTALSIHSILDGLFQ